MPADLQDETTAVLQRLIRFNTVNPPGNERPAIEYLTEYVREAGLETTVVAADDERPNLVATIEGSEAGPTLCYLAHVDTVLADPSEWTHDPWSGEIADGFLWGRGAIDMKAQLAAEAVGAIALTREGWRPRRGALKLVFVSDEETGGGVGADWLTQNHPELVRCDMLLNEGAGAVFELDGRRMYGVCCGEKGVFRFKLTARGHSGHASLPRTGENALLKLGPVLDRLATHQPQFDVTEAPADLLRAIGEDPANPEHALKRIGESDPALLVLLEPMLGVTLTPTMIHASDKMNVIPSRAYVKVDCRVPPGMSEELVRTRVDEVLGEEGGRLDFEFTETITGNSSHTHTELMSTIDDWVTRNDPGAETVPVILPGFSDSKWFRAAFPECVAYGFFPMRHMSMLTAGPLMHSVDERIDVRDLGFAAGFYRDLARGLLG
jgi:acetylornithine deacetylase/succinyl-diaminopimelate desuccinylase-like protein